MTNEDVMKAFGIHTYSPAYDRDAEATVEFLKDTIALMECIKSETSKYRWHDLRKNPEDLPDDEYEGDVLVSLYGIDGHIHYHHGLKLAYWCGSKYGFFDDYETNSLVEGWKYLDRFEEDTDD